MDRYKLILSEWRTAASESDRNGCFTFSSPPYFSDAARECWRSREYGLLAAILEAQGYADLVLIRANPQMIPITALGSIGSLVRAAHWHRLAGDPERSAMAGARAVREVKEFLDREAAGEIELPAEHVRWYALEMAGDAAVCADRSEAARFYQQASALYQTIDPLDEQSDAQEIWPGDYQRALADPLLLPDFLPELTWMGQDRIRFKLRVWCGGA